MVSVSSSRSRATQTRSASHFRHSLSALEQRLCCLLACARLPFPLTFALDFTRTANMNNLLSMMQIALSDSIFYYILYLAGSSITIESFLVCSSYLSLLIWYFIFVCNHLTTRLIHIPVLIINTKGKKYVANMGILDFTMPIQYP